MTNKEVISNIEHDISYLKTEINYINNKEEKAYTEGEISGMQSALGWLKQAEREMEDNND